MRIGEPLFTHTIEFLEYIFRFSVYVVLWLVLRVIYGANEKFEWGVGFDNFCYWRNKGIMGYNLPLPVKLDIKRHFTETADVWKDRIYKDRGRQGFFEYFDKQYRFDYVLEMISSLKCGRVLDIGCGAGQLLPHLVKTGHQVDAIDISEKMVELSQRLCPKAVVKVGDCEKLDYYDRSFDLVVAMGVLEYLPDEYQMMSEVARVLKPGGTFILTIRNRRCALVRLRNAFSNVHSKEHFVDFLIKPGSLNVVETRYCHYHLFPWPVSKWFPFSLMQAVGGKMMEKRFKDNPKPALASTCIIRMTKWSD